MPLRRAALAAFASLVCTTGCSGVSASIEDGSEATEGPSSGGSSGDTSSAATGGATGADGANGTPGGSSSPSSPGADAGAGVSGGGAGGGSGGSGGSASGDAGADATTGTTASDGGTGSSHDAAADATADAAPPPPPPPPPTCSHPIPSAITAPATIDLGCFTSTFTDDFGSYDISSGPVADGKNANERWFNGTDECCMDPSNGWPGVMYPTPAQTTNQAVNPYSLLPGGGLQISLTQQNDEWFSGVMTTVDANENGFAQAYGYFEMTTQLPAGTGTWPSFWMLSLPRSAPGGEIDIFEQLGCSPPLNPAVEKIFHFTLHDWKDGTTPLAYTAQDLPDLTAGYHRYGMLWNRTYMALYFDGALLTSAPTPSVMIDVKYFLLADLGIGAGWDTTQTPSPSNMLIKSINAYSVPGF